MKGLSPLLIWVLLLAAILMVSGYGVSHWFRIGVITKRFLYEASIIGLADKVETYIKSFNKAVELSLLQASYDEKNYSNAVWQDYNKINVPSETTILNNIGRSVEEYVRGYLASYIEFVAKNKENLNLPDTSSIIKKLISWDTSFITIEFNDIKFSGSERGIEVERIFRPNATLRTKLKRVLDLTRTFTKNDVIGNKIKELNLDQEKCTADNVKNIITDLLGNIQKEFNESYKNEKIAINLTLKDVKADWSKAKVPGPSVCSGSYNCDILRYEECIKCSGCHWRQEGCYPQFSCAGLDPYNCARDPCCTYDSSTRECIEVCFLSGGKCYVEQGCTKPCVYMPAGCYGGANSCSGDFGCDCPGCTLTPTYYEVYKCCIEVLVKVEMNDISNKFPVYNRIAKRAVEDYLGFIYLVKTGNC